MSLFDVLADRKIAEELDAAVVILTRGEDRGPSRNGILLTRELVDDLFQGDPDRAVEAIRSGVVDHEATRRIDSPDKVVHRIRDADGAERACWTLAVFSRDDLGLFEGPVRTRKTGSAPGGSPE